MRSCSESPARSPTPTSTTSPLPGRAASCRCNWNRPGRWRRSRTSASRPKRCRWWSSSNGGGGQTQARPGPDRASATASTGLALTGPTPILDLFSDAPRATGATWPAVAGVAVDGIGPISKDGEAVLPSFPRDRRQRPGRGRRGGGGRSVLPAGARAAAAARLSSTGPGGIAADLQRTSLASEAARHAAGRDRRPRPPPPAPRRPGAGAGAAAAGRRSPPHPVAVGIAYLLIEAGWITVNGEGTHALTRPDLRRLPGLLAAPRPPLPRGAGAGKPVAEALPPADEGESIRSPRIGRHRDRGDAGPACRRPPSSATDVRCPEGALAEDREQRRQQGEGGGEHRRDPDRQDRAEPVGRLAGRRRSSTSIAAITVAARGDDRRRASRRTAAGRAAAAARPRRSSSR